MRDLFYNIKYGIRNLITWIPIVWQDRQWDYRYLYKILHTKLSLMEEHFNRDDPTIVGSRKYGKQIQTAKNLAKRLMQDDYLENAMLWHDQKFEEINFNDLWERVPDSIYSTYIGDQNIARQESFGKCCRHSEYMEDTDRRYLFQLISDKIGWWWD